MIDAKLQIRNKNKNCYRNLFETDESFRATSS